MTNREKYINIKPSVEEELKGTSTKNECEGKECKKCEHYLECYAIAMGVTLGVKYGNK